MISKLTKKALSYKTKKPKRKLGACKDKIILSDKFNKTSKKIIESFYK